MKKRYLPQLLLLLLILFAGGQLLNAQTLPMFERYFGTNSNDFSGYTYYDDVSNSYYHLGNTDGPADLTNLDINGNINWSKIYESPAFFRTMVTAPNGDLILLGGRTVAFGRWENYIVRTDPSGTLIWGRGYNQTGRRFNRNAIVRSTGDSYIIKLWHVTAATGSDDQLLIFRINGATGSPIWTRTLDSGDFQVNGFCEDGFGGCYFGGSVGLGGPPFIGQFDVNGNLIELKRDLGSPAHSIESLALSSSSNQLLIGGQIYSGTPGYSSFFALADLNFNFIWGREFTSPVNAPSISLPQIQEGADGKIYFSTRIQSSGSRLDPTLGRVDFSGNLERYNYFNHPLEYWAITLSGTLPERIVASGSIDNSATGTAYDHWAMVLDTSFQSCYPGLAPPAPTPMSLTWTDWLLMEQVESLVVDTLPNWGPISYHLDTLCDSFPIIPSPCFATNDTNFSTLNPVGPLTGYTTLNGKIYVPDNTIITVSGPGTVLDVTNVDMVFGECSGIDLENGASIRANNSVFRTCEEDLSWRGINLTEIGASRINECTFKNAQAALNFVTAGTGNLDSASCTITNNLFSHCRIGLRTDQVVMTDGISGNTFHLDQRPISFSPTACLPLPSYSNDHYGILGLGSQFQGLIAQNNFVSAQSLTNSRDLYGIYMLQSQARISLNQFTNCFRGIELAQCQVTSIENNTFEVTQNFGSLANQIRVSGESAWIWIVGNNLFNSFEPQPFTLPRAAIYIENSAIVNVKENTVVGFNIGVYADRLFTSQIAENTLLNQNIYGIYLRDGNDVDVNCNQINPRYSTTQFTGGIIYVPADPNSSGVEIRSNCIHDVRYGIINFALGGNPLPVIRNNYLYNYSQFGIYNIAGTGSIGTGFSTPVQAARNSFHSNNTGGSTNPVSFDVFSTVPINVVGNSGIANVNANVFTNGNGLYQSTTACGNQPGSLNAEYIPEDVCDTYAEEMDGTFRLAQLGLFAQISALESAKGSALFGLTRAFAFQLIAEGHPERVEDLLNFALNNHRLETDMALRLGYQLKLATGDQAGADQLIANATADGGWAQLTLVEHQLNQGNALSQDDTAWLNDMSEGDDILSAQVRDLLRARFHRADFHFKDIFIPDFKTEERAISVSEAGFLVFPNPSQGNLNLQYSLEHPDQGLLEIYDLQGKLVFKTDLTGQTAVQEFDLTDMEEGLYLISVSDGEQRLGTTKWRKD